MKNFVRLPFAFSRNAVERIIMPSVIDKNKSDGVYFSKLIKEKTVNIKFFWFL
jgi:hypothetical protein